jgi:hypothetical protein
MANGDTAAVRHLQRVAIGIAAIETIVDQSAASLAASELPTLFV